jgi:chromosomal replication initiation ATPase DnaA
MLNTRYRSKGPLELKIQAILAERRANDMEARARDEARRLKIAAERAMEDAERAALEAEETRAREMNSTRRSKRIIKAAAVYFGIPVDDLVGARRTKDLVIPRQITMYAIYAVLGENRANNSKVESYTSIGRHFNGRDHTTVVWAVKVIRKLSAKGDKRVVDALAFLTQIE